MILDKLFIGIILAIFGGIVLHAPVSVALGSAFPDIDIVVKAWKELLMVPAALLALLLLRRHRRWDIVKSPWVLLPASYVLLHLLLIPWLFTNWTAVLAGLAIDLRYIVFFVLVYILIRLYPALRYLILFVFLLGALVVGTFALAQVLVLPPDVLSLIGYGDGSIQPYLTVDENPEYIRINSTLRGPNPLGAYAVIVLALLAAYWWRVGRSGTKLSAKLMAGWVALSTLVALWFSYSRSALVAAVIALTGVFLLTVGRRLHRWVWVSLVVVVFAVMGGLFVARDTSFVSNVILHENDGTGAEVSSNEDHVTSLAYGLDRLVQQPLGAGIGSTGSASLFTDRPVIIENQYLLIAHEVGWLGLALFLILFAGVLWACWLARRDWLALAVLASGVGLALIGILLPVWVDDTVAVIWWGLAALAIGTKGGSDGRAIDKTSKRAA